MQQFVAAMDLESKASAVEAKFYQQHNRFGRKSAAPSEARRRSGQDSESRETAPGPAGKAYTLRMLREDHQRLKSAKALLERNSAKNEPAALEPQGRLPNRNLQIYWSLTTTWPRSDEHYRKAHRKIPFHFPAAECRPQAPRAGFQTDQNYSSLTPLQVLNQATTYSGPTSRQQLINRSDPASQAWLAICRTYREQTAPGFGCVAKARGATYLQRRPWLSDGSNEGGEMGSGRRCGEDRRTMTRRITITMRMKITRERPRRKLLVYREMQGNRLTSREKRQRSGALQDAGAQGLRCL